MMRDDKSFDWGVCSAKYDCTGSLPVPQLPESFTPSVTPTIAIEDMTRVEEEKASGAEVLSDDAKAASSAMEVAKLAKEAAHDATEAADQTETIRDSFSKGKYAYSAIGPAVKKTDEAQDSARQLDLITKTALGDAHTAISVGGKAETEAQAAHGFMKEAMHTADEAMKSADQAAMDMAEVKSLNALDAESSASSSAAVRPTEYEKNAMHLMENAAAKARTAAQDATRAAAKADAANEAMGEMVKTVTTRSSK
jgi:hypothetical protein